MRNLEFTGKPVPKTFAVCTIRSTPSTAHHCIAWSKSYLFPYVHLSSLARYVSIQTDNVLNYTFPLTFLPPPYSFYSQLFGADDESDQQELDDAEKNGENG